MSLKAIRKILPYLREGYIYSYAVFLANMEIVIGKEVWNNEEDRNLIKREIKALIQSFNETRQQENMVNDLVAKFRESHKNAGKNYVLDKQDKNDIKAKILSVYGEKRFEEFVPAKKEQINQSIESLYQEQLQKPKAPFIKPRRLDERIKDFLRANFNASDKQLEALYHPSDIEAFLRPKRSNDGNLYLGSPRISSIKNPMAMRTMHQLRKLVNEMIKEEIIGEDTVIHVELTRELNDANRRAAIKKWQDERRNQRNNYKNKIKELYKEQCGEDIEPSGNDILKYEMWEEQGHGCLYTGDCIGICDFIGADPKYDMEHTIPRSVSFDDSMQNLTLCSAEYNRKIKKNRIPSELPKHKEILERIERWKDKIENYEKLYNSRRKSRGIETKEQKDKRIQQKHYFKMHLDYWREKYARFTREDVPQGFKNSQIVDTGIITKYARAYLKSVFERVYTVKGAAVAQFRKVWGIQDEYKNKERSSHVHHCIDAITIACMTRDKYDLLARFYHEDEQGNQRAVKQTLRELKPWNTFTEDVKAFSNEVPVVHYTPDNIHKRTKKKLRKRDKIVRDKRGNPLYQQGDTARGALHKEKFYGAVLADSEKGEREIKYVLRKALVQTAGLDLLKENEIEKIVDKHIREKVRIAAKEHGFRRLQDGSVTIWMDKEKQVPIKKVRCYAPTVTDPIHIKKHRDLSKHEHKQDYHVMNAENYCMAIYEGKTESGKIHRSSELVNMKVAAEYYRMSNADYRKRHPIVPETHPQTDDPLKVVIRKGQMVLLYDKEPKEIWDFPDSKKITRLYKITQLDKEASGIKLLYHQEAREKKGITKHMGLKGGMKGGKLIDQYQEFPWIKVSPNEFDALVEGVDFEITPTGKINRL